MIEFISSKGTGEVNEDCVCYKGNKFWVFDGVTPITNKLYYSDKSDANYIVNNLSDVMLNIPNIDELDNCQLLTCAMENLRSKLKKKEFSEEEKIYQPSFALAIVNIDNTVINIDILSDCYVIVKLTNEIKVFTDMRIRNISNETQKVKKYIKENCITEKIAKKFISKQILENRKRMNSLDGYWVGTIDGLALNNTIHYSLNRQDVKELLICSDGFYRVFSFSLFDMYEFFNSKVKLEDVIKILRDFEDQSIKNSELKRSDDATAIKITL